MAPDGKLCASSLARGKPSSTQMPMSLHPWFSVVVSKATLEAPSQPVLRGHAAPQALPSSWWPAGGHPAPAPLVSAFWKLPSYFREVAPARGCGRVLPSGSLSGLSQTRSLPAPPAHRVLSPGAALGPAVLQSSNVTCSTACHPLGVCLSGSRCSPACHRARHTEDAHEELQPDECPATVTAVHSLT